jgi:hypothetical protein
MPKFAPNTGFKMPGLGSKEIDSPSNFRDEQHVDKVGYCDTTEDSMLPKGSSPLKARYTSSGYLKDLDAITIPVSKKSESESKPKPAPSPTPTPKKTVDFNADVDFGKIEPDYEAIKVEGKTPGKTKTTPGSKKGGTGIPYEDKFKTLSKAEQEKFGTWQNLKKAGEEWWEKKNATTKTTPGSGSSISGKTRIYKKGDL